ncbi:unnamed protein product [Amaranthus hypochondriacus]
MKEDLKQKGLYDYNLPNRRGMMEDFKQTGFNNYNLHNESMISVHRNVNNQLTRSTKPLDLNLAADEFIKQCADDFSGNAILSRGLDNLDLSLSLGLAASNMNGKGRSWKEKNTFSSSLHIIDLEDPNLSFPNYDAKHGLSSSFAALNYCSRDKHKIDFSEKGKKVETLQVCDIYGDSYRNTSSRSRADAGSSCQTQSLCDSGINGHHRNLFILSKNPKSTSGNEFNLDLNLPFFEDPSHISNDHSLAVNSSITSSYPVIENVCRKSNVASSVSPASLGAFSELIINCQKDVKPRDNERGKCLEDGKFREWNATNINFIDLSSDSSEELCSSRSDPKISSVGSSSKVSVGLSHDMDLENAVKRETNLDKGVEPFEQANYSKLFGSSESEVMADHHSSSTKTMQSGVGCDDINFPTSNLRKETETGPLAAHSGEDVRSSDSIESDIQCCASMKASEETDERVLIAAELLVDMGRVMQPCSQAETSKLPENEEEDKPQRSLDSYEVMVLSAEACNPDDYFVSSNAFSVDVSEKKDVKYKLKRGTRMRDFQKDILPSLSTLSRQEILEDVNLLKGVIRSREYKRMRANVDDGGDNWCRSARNKRSRANRRYYS